MALEQRLNDALGKNIDVICPNKFHDANANHCAHFVSHICDLDFSYHCVGFKGGSGAPANIRVHEVFAQCPRVGRWEDADTSRTQLAFITRKDVVDLAAKRMGNIPQKHIGVYHGGQIYHYANGSDRVIREAPAAFKAKFQKTYDGDQGLFFGWIPGETLRLNVRTEGVEANARKAFDIRGPIARKWEARLTGDADYFPVGREVKDSKKGYYGLYTPVADYWGPVYRGDDHRAALDHWAYLLEATGACESENRFILVNSYDRAKFTFGFYQLAAHTPRDNLILLFRRLAELDAFNDYFPDLKIDQGKLCRIDGDGTRTDLEREFFDPKRGEHQLLLFMNYLNPLRQVIEPQEALQAARLIHWTINDAGARRAQIQVAGEILQRKMTERYHPKLGLDGRSDQICAAVADIFHQGRANVATVRKALASADPLEALLTINDGRYAGRNTRLRHAIAALSGPGKLGTRTYDAATNQFQS